MRSLFSGNFPEIARKLLAKIPQVDSRKSYAFEAYPLCLTLATISIILYTVALYIYAWLTLPSVRMFILTILGHRIPFQFLEDLKSRFQGTYTTPDLQGVEAFSRVLKERM